MVILAGVMLAGVGWFTILGLAQRRRTMLMARLANRTGMRFSREDPFDIPRVHGDFLLLASGHSRCASNVTFGRSAEKRVHACDYHYEIGHGMLRSTRHYGVVLVDVQIPLPSLLMWNDLDFCAAPLDLLLAEGKIRRWIYVGDGELAKSLAQACGELAERGVSIQAAGSTLMLCMPMRTRGQNYADMLAALPVVLDAIASANKHAYA